MNSSTEFISMLQQTNFLFMHIDFLRGTRESVVEIYSFSNEIWNITLLMPYAATDLDLIRAV